jgi:hypothetical protein
MKPSLLPTPSCTYAQFKSFPIEQAFPTIPCEFNLFSLAKSISTTVSHPSTQPTHAF